MTAETAQTILYCITAVAAVVWICSAMFLKWSAKVGTRAPSDRFEIDRGRTKSSVAGTVEVDGQADTLADKAAAALAGKSDSLMAAVKILEKTHDQLTFEGVTSPSGKHQMGQCFGRGTLRFRSQGGDRTAIEYDVEIVGGRGLLIGGGICVVLGLAAIGIGFWLIQTLVIPNENPAVRGQVFQMFQCVHFLWPPFLFGAIYRFRFRAVRTALETLLHNLPYTD